MNDTPLSIHPVSVFSPIIGFTFCSIVFWKTEKKKTALNLATLWFSIILVVYWLSLDRSALELSYIKVRLNPISIYILLPILFTIISVSLSYHLEWWFSIPLMYMIPGTSFILIDLIVFLILFETIVTFKIGYYGFYDYIFLFSILGVIINVMTNVIFLIGFKRALV